MKILQLKSLFLAIAFFTVTVGAHAEANLQDYTTPYEDTPEFLAPQDALYPLPSIPKNFNDPLPLLLSGTGTWAYEFKLIKPDGTTQVLAEHNKDLMLKPASTIKLFVGWWAYKERIYKTSFISTMLKTSNNAMAQRMYNYMGGATAMENYYLIKGLPLDSTNFISVDGSGLSYDNQLTPALAVQHLEMVRADKTYKTFRSYMAQPGSTGTLSTRLKEFRGLLFGKTGTLKDTAALAGFLETKKGTIVFSMISNDLTISLPLARKKIDSFVRTQYAAVKQL